MMDYPAREHEGETCDELLIRKRENQSVQNIASKPTGADPLGLLFFAEQAIQFLRQKRRIGHQDLV